MDCEITYDQLAAYATGDLGDTLLAEIRNHLPDCQRCSQRIAAINRADATLKHLPPLSPEPGAVLAARRALAEELRDPGLPEIMTLAEVGDFLRLTPDQLGEIAEELPAFELAGQIRIRRAKLEEWLQQRERDYSRQAAASWAARGDRDAFRQQPAL